MNGTAPQPPHASRAPSRRAFLRWLALGLMGLTIAAFSVPLGLARRLRRPPRPTAMPSIPTRPLDPATLRDPHDLAG